jgi:hypothetical protein
MINYMINYMLVIFTVAILAQALVRAAENDGVFWT